MPTPLAELHVDTDLSLVRAHHRANSRVKRAQAFIVVLGA